MRRRRKRKQKKINTARNLLIEERFEANFSEDCVEKLDYNNIDQSEICQIQTEDVKQQRGVLKKCHDIGFQFPEEIITSKRQLKVGKNRKWHFVVQKHRKIRFNRRLHSCTFALRTCRPLSTQSKPLVRIIEGVSRVLVRMRNSTVAISNVLLDGLGCIGKLLEVMLEVTFKTKDKLSIKRKNKGDMLVFEGKLDSISKDIANLTNIIVGECARLNQRIDGVETKQNNIHSTLHTLNTRHLATANNNASNPFIPPPPPLPPPTNHRATPTNTAKRSLSNITVSHSKTNERIAITVEDLRNVKLRPRTKTDVAAVQPFISPQMLNGVKLRPTSREQTDVTVTGPRQSGKFNTL